MARLFSISRGFRLWTVISGIGLPAVFFSPLYPAPIEPGVTNNPALSLPFQPLSPTSSLTNTPPPLPPDTWEKYGKILKPGDQAAYPLKLKMPFPSFGEVKVPTPDELIMREKLEQLARLSDAEIRKQLAEWPAYGKMNLRDQGLMLQRIQDLRDYRNNAAKTKAHDLGLLTLSPDEQAKFAEEYWTKRMQLDQDLSKQFTPVFKAAQQKMLDELYREFSTMTPVPSAQPPQPTVSPATPEKTTGPASAP